MSSTGTYALPIIQHRLILPRLAPEHVFPVGVNDCWDALKWAVANAEILKANPRRGLIVGGAVSFGVQIVE